MSVGVFPILPSIVRPTWPRKTKRKFQQHGSMFTGQPEKVAWLLVKK